MASGKGAQHPVSVHPRDTGKGREGCALSASSGALVPPGGHCGYSRPPSLLPSPCLGLCSPLPPMERLSDCPSIQPLVPPGPGLHQHLTPTAESSAWFPHPTPNIRLCPPPPANNKVPQNWVGGEPQNRAQPSHGLTPVPCSFPTVSELASLPLPGHPGQWLKSPCPKPSKPPHLLGSNPMCLCAALPLRQINPHMCANRALPWHWGN